MRKILLGTTAIAASALFAPQDAKAQGADPFLPAGPPMVSHRALEVRVGGYFRFNYNFTDQDGSNATNRAGTSFPAGSVSIPSNTAGNPTGGTAATNFTPTGAPQSTNTGKSDFASDAEIHIVANGKATNGLRYGGAIELQVDQNDGTAVSTNRTSVNKTFVNTDEMWMYIASDFGQIRLGDEDGVLGGLMNSGHITNFGTGGIDGDWFDSVINVARATTSFPGDVGDNTKVTYLSPQFFGFDVGASFAFNTGEGEDTGCVLNYASPECDRANASSGASRRRNELQLAARWRGSFSGVGISVTGGAILADPTKSISATTGLTNATSEQFRLFQGGAQVTAFGFLVGGFYTWGDANAGYSVLGRSTVNAAGVSTGLADTRNFRQYVVGASYTLGQVTVGANYMNAVSAGNQAVAGGRREQVLSIGGTYRIAPGLEAVAEYNKIRRRESGFDFVAVGAGANNNRVEADVIIVGTRIAF